MSNDHDQGMTKAPIRIAANLLIGAFRHCLDIRHWTLSLRSHGSSFQAGSFVADHVRGIPRSGIREFFDLVQSTAGVISLGVGEPDFVTPWHIREAAILRPRTRQDQLYIKSRVCSGCAKRSAPTSSGTSGSRTTEKTNPGDGGRE
jgi:hypothetical protein